MASAHLRRRREAELTERLVNLSALLEEENEDVPPLPIEACAEWTEADVREYYRLGGAYAPPPVEGDSSSEDNIPGGSRAQGIVAEEVTDHDSLPPAMLESEAYRVAAFRTGIPFRPDGLFPPNDALLARLAAEAQDGNLRPFEKHLVTEGALAPSRESWAAGNSAASHGLDLRTFLHLDPQGGPGHKISAAVRFGRGSAIGMGFSAHGGAIETSLDEATAELCKATQGVMCFTTEATFKLTKQVLLHRTYLIEASITKLGPGDVRVYIDASLSDADTGQVAATCSVQLANMGKLRRR